MSAMNPSLFSRRLHYAKSAWSKPGTKNERLIVAEREDTRWLAGRSGYSRLVLGTPTTWLTS
jgi:hypothetical protein